FTTSSPTFKPKEPTFQVALDVLSLTPFYQEFLITTSVLAIYMHEFWATVTFQKQKIKFKINKSYSFDLETFRDMFQICLKVPGQKFVDPPFKEEILAFMSDLGYLGNIKTLSKESEAYKTYYAFATGKAIPKPKYVRRSVKEKTEQAPKASFGKRIKSTAKVTRSRKKKQIAEGLETLSEVALYEAEQMKLAIERSKTQLHSSQPSDDDDETSVSKDEDDDNQEDDDDQEDNDDQGDKDGRTDLDNDGDDFFYPKFLTHDQDERQDEEDSFDPRVQTPSHVETTDDEDNDEENQDVNVKGDELDEEETNEEDEGDELYRDGQQQYSSVSSGFISNMLNPSPDTSIDSIFNLNTESTSLVDVPVTTNVEPPLLSAITLSSPPTPLITHLQQTPVPALATVPSSSLQDLPNFGSFFGFDDRLKTLEIDFSEFKQTNQFAKAVSSIPSIVDLYLANKMNEAIKIADQVKEQVKAQVSKILPKIKKIVNEQLEAEVLTRSSNASKTSHAVAANLSELKLKKILIDKMESNKSIHRSNEQNNLYKPLVEAYKSDKLILDTYVDTVTLKRRRDDEDTARSNRGSKRRRVGKELESTSVPKDKTSKTTGKSTEGSKSHHKSTGESAQAKEPMHTAKDLE
nr:hypothetical protein [Tanacetum cinerariifolium]